MTSTDLASCTASASDGKSAALPTLHSFRVGLDCAFKCHMTPTLVEGVKRVREEVVWWMGE